MRRAASLGLSSSGMCGAIVALEPDHGKRVPSLADHLQPPPDLSTLTRP